MLAKEAAKQVIDSLPDDATMDDIIHALYINVKFSRGESEIRAGRGITHEEAKERLRKWLK
jgi:predicted transcriptional regulator